jgi:hypothetical protein
MKVQHGSDEGSEEEEVPPLPLLGIGHCGVALDTAESRDRKYSGGDYRQDDDQRADTEISKRCIGHRWNNAKPGSNQPHREHEN